MFCWLNWDHSTVYRISFCPGEVYLETCETYKMQLFAEKINGFQQLDFCQGSEHAFFSET